MTYYINFNTTTEKPEFIKTPEQQNLLTDAFIELTDEQYQELWIADQAGETIYQKGKKILHAIPEDLMTDAEKAEIMQNNLIAQAKAILASTSGFGGDWQCTIDKFAEYPADKQAAIIEYRKQLRAVINKERDTLPDVPKLEEENNNVE